MYIMALLWETDTFDNLTDTSDLLKTAIVYSEEILMSIVRLKLCKQQHMKLSDRIKWQLRQKNYATVCLQHKPFTLFECYLPVQLTTTVF